MTLQKNNTNQCRTLQNFLKALVITCAISITACSGGSGGGGSSDEAEDLSGPPIVDKPAFSDSGEEPADVALEEARPLWEESNSRGKEWTSHVMNALDHLGKDLLQVIPKDTKLFCPRYSSLSYAQRKQYWAFFLSSMARFESNFNTNLAFREGFKDPNGKYVISRGLLQISILSGNGYDCEFRSNNDLHDAYQNLSCGIRILNRWIGNDGIIAGKVRGDWKGGARYWSVLREGNKTSYKSIVKWTSNLPFCKK